MTETYHPTNTAAEMCDNVLNIGGAMERAGHNSTAIWWGMFHALQLVSHKSDRLRLAELLDYLALQLRAEAEAETAVKH